MDELPISQQKDFGYYLSKIISYLLHPLLMPSYGFALLFYTKNYISTFTASEAKFMILLITFAFTFFFPFLNALILLKMKRINSLEMETSKERIAPYISTTFYFFALFYLFYDRHLPPLFYMLILGAGISIFSTLIINFKWKISAHTVGVGGIIGAIIGLSQRLQINLDFILVVMLCCGGLIGFARLKLNAHTPAQVYTGYALGFIVEYLLMILY